MLRSTITAPPGGGRESRAESSTQAARPTPDASIRRRLRVAGADITAKEFRTWHGSVAAY